MDLRQIAAKYDTDKAVNTHYLQNYEKLFGPLRDREIRLLELGIYKGGSLLLWRDYFPKGLIVGLDIKPFHIDAPGERIRTYQGAQQDSELLDRIAREVAPGGFDVIIDDCSHIGVISRASFWHLFDNHLKSGGIYAIEDWGTGYWESWVDGVPYKPRRNGYSSALPRLIWVFRRMQRSSVANHIPFARSLLVRVKGMVLKRQYHSHNAGMVGFIKELIDEAGAGDITHPEFGAGPHRPSRFREMRISHGHLFVIKS